MIELDHRPQQIHQLIKIDQIQKGYLCYLTFTLTILRVHACSHLV